MITSFKLHRQDPLKQRDDSSWHGTIVFEIVSDDDLTSEVDIISHPFCPARGSSHPTTPHATLREFSPDPVSGFHNLHHLTCTYDSRPDDDDDPADQLRKAGFRAQDREVPAYFDAFGRPNVNTAGDLIENLVAIKNEFITTVTLKKKHIPIWLFELNNTLNASPVYYRGVWFPTGTCMLKNMQVGDEPDRDGDGNEYWTLTFDIVHNPDGFFELHPNRGKHEVVYQTRSVVDPQADPIELTAFKDDTYSNWSEEDNPERKRRIKRRIKGDDDKSMAADAWLDSLGRAVKTPVIRTTELDGTASMTKGKNTVWLSEPFFDTSDEQRHTGASIAIGGVGPHRRILRTRIAEVLDEKIAVLEDPAAITRKGRKVWLPGVQCLRIVNQPLANWKPVLLPNNDPQ